MYRISWVSEVAASTYSGSPPESGWRGRSCSGSCESTRRQHQEARAAGLLDDANGCIRVVPMPARHKDLHQRGTAVPDREAVRREEPRRWSLAESSQRSGRDGRGEPRVRRDIPQGAVRLRSSGPSGQKGLVGQRRSVGWSGQKGFLDSLAVRRGRRTPPPPSAAQSPQNRAQHGRLRLRCLCSTAYRSGETSVSDVAAGVVRSGSVL